MTNTASSYLKELAPRMPTKYLQDFFAEKDIPEEVFELEGPSGPSLIPNGVVVEHFLIASQKEIRAIEEKLREIDFHNCSVNRFLKHIAQALVK